MDHLGYVCTLCSIQRSESELDFYVLPPKDDLSVVDEKTSHRKNVCGISPFKKRGGLSPIYACMCFLGRKSFGSLYTILEHWSSQEGSDLEGRRRDC